MKIISPFKDYYDYLSTQYGIDDNIVYNRQPLVILNNKIDKQLAKNTLREIARLVECFHCHIVIKNIEYIFKTVFILGKIYIVVTKITTDNKSFTRLATKEDFINICELTKRYRDRTKKYKDDRVNYIKSFNVSLRTYGNNERFIQAWANGSTKLSNNFLFNSNSLISTKIGVLEDSNNIIMNFHKVLQEPVFSTCVFHGGMNVVGYNHNYNILGDNDVVVDIPNLSEIQGISGTISTFEMYQGISNFLVELKGNVDLIPPVELANNDKIVKAGFDTKTSFRHPVNVIRRKK